MKYIIDIPADTEWIEICKIIDSAWHGTMRMALSDLTPYNPEFQSDLLEDIRKQIEDEVWDTAIKISIADNGWSWQEMTYQEAKARYEEWKKQKDEIRVGDEVETESGNKACVLYENPDGTQVFVFKADGTTAWWSKCSIYKTGKNYSQVAELLKEMGEKNECQS